MLQQTNKDEHKGMIILNNPIKVLNINLQTKVVTVEDNGRIGVLNINKLAAKYNRTVNNILCALIIKKLILTEKDLVYLDL